MNPANTAKVTATESTRDNLSRFEYKWTAYSMFTQGADGAIMSAAGHFGRRLVPMVTYDDLFTFVIMLCAIVTLVLNFKRKKYRSRPGKLKRYFL